METQPSHLSWDALHGRTAVGALVSHQKMMLMVHGASAGLGAPGEIPGGALFKLLPRIQTCTQTRTANSRSMPFVPVMAYDRDCACNVRVALLLASTSSLCLYDCDVTDSPTLLAWKGRRVP